MKQDAGILLVVFGLFFLWAYNTGRAAAIVSVIKNPSTAVPTVAPLSVTKDNSSAPQNSSSSSSSGGSDVLTSVLTNVAWGFLGI